LVQNSTCFGQIYCPSWGVLILYTHQLVFVILVMLNASEVWTPDDGQQIRPKHVEFCTKINLRNSASCWFLL